VGLNADLGHGSVAIDTSILIDFIEEDPRFLSLVLPLFEAADRGKRELVTSAVTLLEVLIVPYRAGDAQLAERYELLLTRSRGVRMVDITRDHSERQRSSVQSPASRRRMRCNSCARLPQAAGRF
jgi:predicted nucleic acid-binding protein